MAASTIQTQWLNDQRKTSAQIRQEVIRELELLLDQLDGKDDLPARTPRPSTRQTSQRPNNTAKPRTGEQNTNVPSLLFNPEWKPGIKTQKDTKMEGYKADEILSGKSSSSAEEPASASVNSFSADSAHLPKPDMATSVEKLYELMHGWCQTDGHKKTRSKQTRKFLFDLEQINESLFSFS